MFSFRWLRKWFSPKAPLPRSNASYQGIPYIAELPGGRRVYSTLIVREQTPTKIVFTNGSTIKAARPGSLNARVSGGTVIITDWYGNSVMSIGGGSTLSSSQIEID